MDCATFKELHLAMTVINAEERLEEIGVYNFADLKEEAKSRIKRHYHKQSRPNLFESDADTKENSTKEVAAKLGVFLGGQRNPN